MNVVTIGKLQPFHRALLVGASALFIAGCAGDGETTAGQGPSATEQTEDQAAEELAVELAGLSLEELYDVSYKALVARSPETVLWNALSDEIPLGAPALDDLSEDYQRETLAMYQTVLTTLTSHDRAALDEDQQLDYDIYAWFLEDEIERGRFFFHDFRASYSLWGVQSATQRLFTDIHPLVSAQDAHDYVARLAAVEHKLGQLADHLKAQRDEGIVEPRLSMDVAIGQVEPLAANAPEANPYYTTLRDRIGDIADLDGDEAEELLDRARSIVASDITAGYQRLLNTMRGLRSHAPASIGVGQYPAGDDYYAYRLRHHTTSDLSPAEVHQLGLDELARIHQEMRAIFDELGYPQDATLEELFALVAEDGGEVPAREVLATYEQIIDDAQARLGEAFEWLPEASVIVKPDPFGGFYIGPSYDGQRPGAFYAGNSQAEAAYAMRSLAYHEAVPGHHLQIALAMEAEAPLFRKFERSTGFVEGWALYAEHLAHELGWYEDDPYGDLGRLQFEALRAARLVIDTGIHAFGWNFDRSSRFNRENVGWAQGPSQGAAARYSVSPGQASAYMVGFLTIRSERERARAALGDAFDLKRFHRAVLESGGVPLTLLPAVVDRYIAAETAP